MDVKKVLTTWKSFQWGLVDAKMAFVISPLLILAAIRWGTVGSAVQTSLIKMSVTGRGLHIGEVCDEYAKAFLSSNLTVLTSKGDQ